MKTDNNFNRLFSYALFLTLMVIIIAGCSSAGANISQDTGSTTSVPSVTEESNTQDNASIIVDATNVPIVSTATLAVGNVNQTEVSFSKDILPIIQKSCVSCHGGEKTSKGLDLKTFASLMAGSQNGQVIIPGDSTGSKVVQSIKSGKMPKRGEKLSAQQLDLLINWVNSGAKDN